MICFFKKIAVLSLEHFQDIATLDFASSPTSFGGVMERKE